MACRIVAVGASAGGVAALRALVGGLSVDLPATVVVVLHVAPGAPGALPVILRRAGPLPARMAEHRAPLHAGQILVAPPGYHVVVGPGRLRLSEAPREHGHRPAIDPLFRSAAEEFGPHAIGIVLSGTGADGGSGLAALADRGGTALVQEPADARYPEMPRHALLRVPSANRHPARELGGVVVRLLADRPPSADGAGLRSRPGRG